MINLYRGLFVRGASCAIVAASLAACGNDVPGSLEENAGANAVSVVEGEQELDDRPNILLIVADDMGYSDLGAFGGEIDTPNIDGLAARGVKLTQFYATASCAPTRAMLMSGLDTHKAGLGNMAEWLSDNQRGQPGYEGVLTDQAISLATLLKDAGYHTYMAGKWHLGYEEEQSPSARGFEQSFALLNGSAMHYDMRRPSVQDPKASFRENGAKLTELPADFEYSTDFYTDYLIRSIDADSEDGKPFFAWAAYTSPHWPLQVPEQYSDKYRDRYNAGYEVLREQRLMRLKELGIVPDSAQLPPLPQGVQPWNDLSQEQQAIDAREMEIYAGMVDNLDVNVGRLLDYLDEKGELDNTLVFFMSDNGADAGDVFNLPLLKGFRDQFANNLEDMGGPDSFVNYGREWAHATTSPFKLWKTFATEGGLRVPAIISMAGGRASGTTSSEIMSAKDVMPTFLEAARTSHPGDDYHGRSILPIDGQSMLPLLQDSEASIHGDDYQFAFEIIGRSGLRRGDWKMTRTDEPAGSGAWELHDLSADPGELRDVSAEHPEVMAQMLDHWQDYEQEMKIIYPDTGVLN